MRLFKIAAIAVLAVWMAWITWQTVRAKQIAEAACVESTLALKAGRHPGQETIYFCPQP